MKKFVYPAVVYYDDDAKVYVVAIDELGLYCEGSTVEEAQNAMNDTLDTYITTALEFNCEIPDPADFNKKVAEFPKNIV